jgi:FkbM family methyltransferase
MRSIVRIIFRKFLVRTIGKLKYQKFYQLLHDISLRGMNYYNSGDFTNSGEISVIELIAGKKQASNNVVVFDVGANVGDYSIILSQYFNKDKTSIYSFEPSKSTFGNLVEKTRQIKNISSKNFGFSDIEGEVTLFYDHVRSELASVYSRDLTGHEIELNNTEKIQVHTIDQFCAKEKIHKIDFIKIDVEGHEWNVLKGAQQMIKDKQIDYIQFEFGEANVDSKKFLRDFYAILVGYDFYRIVKNGLYPLGPYKEEYELFKTINFLAVRTE